MQSASTESKPGLSVVADSLFAGPSETRSTARTGSANASNPACHHCGLPCPDDRHLLGEKHFCCAGCRTVFELLTENGLTQFYDIGRSAGMRFQRPESVEDFDFVEDPVIRRQLVRFEDDTITRVCFHLPAIHCAACVWLLESLPHLNPAIRQSSVHFPRREVTVTFQTAGLRLSELISLLASIGYRPDLKVSDLEEKKPSTVSRRMWLQTGIAGFAFGNIMLFSLPTYFGLDGFEGPVFARLFGWFSLLLAVPVFVFSARDYWESAWIALRQRRLNIEVPIALGLVALMGQSFYEVMSGAGEGYFDSLTGLLFFLLIGRIFQQKTYDRLSFDRDYKAFFPLSVMRRKDGVEKTVSLPQIEVGDRLLIRNGELIPADARLIEGEALIDYSFVTGESRPVARENGDRLFAGGRQTGVAIEVEVEKPVSQSYLASLWNQEVFQKDSRSTYLNLTNRFSRHFTLAVVGVAASAAIYWMAVDASIALKSFTAILIVACPCALALAAPFALGTAQRLLARRNIFVKGPEVIEKMAALDSVVFDKTGTLTLPGNSEVAFMGEALNDEEASWLYSMTRHSTHPLAVRIGETLSAGHFPEPVRSFLETHGCGMEGRVAGHEIWMGSAAWLASRNVRLPVPSTSQEGTDSSRVWVAIDGHFRGCFELRNALRPELQDAIQRLGLNHELSLISGDQPVEKVRFEALFGRKARLEFGQSPGDKLRFVEEQQDRGRTVMMVGDGLNDAGALKRSDVGVAVVENIHAFSPASDVILHAAEVARLDRVIRFSRSTVSIVRLCLTISVLYNLIGVSIAAQGLMSPVICAVLMPLSSVTVVGLASGLAALKARKLS